MIADHQPARAAARIVLPKSLWVLSAISLFADLAGEMAYPLLPLFVTGVLGASPVALGLIEGSTEALVAIMRGFTGYWSDAKGHRVRWVRLGYAIAFAGKCVIVLANGWGVVMGGRFLDRFGKGVRGAPRDALIAESVSVTMRGRAYGFHRALDSAGGVGGSLIAAGFLWWLIGAREVGPGDVSSFRIVLAVAAGMALVAWLLSYLIPRTPPERVRAQRAAHASAKREPLGLKLWIAIGALTLFSLGNSSDTFLLLWAVQLGHSPITAILLYATLSATYAAASYPMGILSDRFGRWRVLASGWAVYAIAYAGFAFVDRASADWLWVIFALYGVSVACTEGTSRAVIADLCPSSRLATALGIFGLMQGVALLLASVAAGWLWSLGHERWVFAIGSTAAVAALAVLPWVSRGTGQTTLDARR